MLLLLLLLLQKTKSKKNKKTHTHTHVCAAQVVQRATAPPLSSRDAPARFAGFSQHYEDYSPAADHLSMMRIALHEMLL